MSAVKFVHVMKRIEALERDISEIHALAADINSSREYSSPVRISLEQQVNNLLNEKTKLMEVRIENAPEYLNPQKKAVKAHASTTRPAFSFDEVERQYFENLRFKRSNYQSEPVNIKAEPVQNQITELKGFPSLAEKSLVKPADLSREDEKTFLKRREDILKNLPPLEY